MNLVTGATGIVGSHVVLALLQNNQQVIACKQKNSNTQRVENLFAYYTPDYKVLFDKIKWVDVDICDVFSIEEALTNITNVYHCAGFVSFNPKDRKKLFSVNESGTRNVVDACLHKGIKALCHVSSIGTIHNLDYTQILTEEVFWKKSGKESDYATSKYNAEREVWRGIEEGLNAVIVNPGVILAPGFWDQSSSRLFDSSYNGNKFYTNGLGSYIAATDVAKVMIRLVTEGLFGQRFILVENNYTFHNILSHIQTSFKKPAPAINASQSLLATARVLEGFLSLFTGKERKITKALSNSAFNKQLFSNQKVKTALNIEFRPTHEVIGEICTYYLSEKAKLKSSL
ncbi:NAD-dependent epimerase [Sphingobacteriaceae bacterium]|nr:NAD-dependent epimerase [Sphingobacteriaceae bacterium]